MSARRRQIAALGAIGQAAAHAAGRIRAVEPVRMPEDLARAVDQLLAAADEVGRLAHREALFVEEARDLGGSP